MSELTKPEGVPEGAACEAGALEEAAERIRLMEKLRRVHSDEAEIERLRGVLSAIKERVCGEAFPNWENTELTGMSRAWIADMCDSVIPPNADGKRTR